MEMTLKFGDTRQDGYRFLAYEKRVRKLSQKTLVSALGGYLAGSIRREDLVHAYAIATSGTVFYREKWCSPKRFKSVERKTAKEFAKLNRQRAVAKKMEVKP